MILTAAVNNVSLAAGRVVVPLVGLDFGAGAREVELLAAAWTLLRAALSVKYRRLINRSGTLVPTLLAGSAGVSGALPCPLLPAPDAMRVAVTVTTSTRHDRSSGGPCRCVE